MVSPAGAVPHQPNIFYASFFSKLKTVAKFVAQLALTIISAVGAALLGAALLPVKFHAVLLPAALTVAIAVFAYWKAPPAAPPTPKKTLPVGAPRGITGGVNNCWLHSGLQLLRSITPVYNWLRSEEIPPELHPFRDFYRLYEQAAEETTSVVVQASSQPLREILAKLHPISPRDTQEDVAEGILDAILDRMPDALKVQREITTYYKEIEAVRERSLEPPKIHLNIPETEDPTLQEMLEHYSSEEVTDPTKVRGYTPTRKETHFLQEPPFLLIEIEQRSKENILSEQKNSKKIEIPPEIALQDFPCAYRLKTVIYHDGGTVTNGHYTALTKGKDGKDYICSDGHIAPTDNLRSSAVCMLHYERVPNQPN